MINSILSISVLLALAAARVVSAPNDESELEANIWQEKWDLIWTRSDEATPGETRELLGKMRDFYSDETDPESEEMLREIHQIFDAIDIRTSTSKSRCELYEVPTRQHYKSSNINHFIDYYIGEACDRCLLGDKPECLKGREAVFINHALFYNRLAEESQERIRLLEKLDKLNWLLYNECEEFSPAVDLGKTADLVADNPVLSDYVDRRLCGIAKLCLNGPVYSSDWSPLKPKKTLEFLIVHAKCATARTRPTLTNTRNLIEASELNETKCKSSSQNRKFLESLAIASMDDVNLYLYVNRCLKRFIKFCANQFEQSSAF